jgi:hypothetical protein
MGVTSDHCLILLRWKESDRQGRVIGEKIFRYEVMWEHHEQFKPFLDDVWQAKGRQRQWTSSRENLLESLDHWALGGRIHLGTSKGRSRPSVIGWRYYVRIHFIWVLQRKKQEQYTVSRNCMSERR